MIKEDYVSFETAKLLKEKGFPQKYNVYHAMVYNEEDYEDEYEVPRMVTETRLIKAGTLSSYPVGVPEPKCYSPTIQMAMKWLREVHNIHADIIIEGNGSCLKYYSNIRPFKIIYATRLGDSIDTIEVGKYNTYKEACEAAIKYCLINLI